MDYMFVLTWLAVFDLRADVVNFLCIGPDDVDPRGVLNGDPVLVRGVIDWRHGILPDHDRCK